jgi:hypothetical protein
LPAGRSQRAASNPRTVLNVLEFAAKLNKEPGPASDVGAGGTVINFNTNVNMLALRAAAVRAVNPVPAPAALAVAPSNRPRVSDRTTGSRQ